MPLINFNQKTRKQNGFTLVELMVAISVFSVAISLSSGAFVNAIKAQRTLNHLMAVNSDASLVFEQLAREIRTGYDFNVQSSIPDCGPDPGLNRKRGDQLKFTRSRDNIDVTYKWDNLNKMIVLKDGGGPFEPVTASNIAVRRLCFELEQSNGTNPWLITIFLTIGPLDQRISQNVLNLQTAVTARILPSEAP